MAGCICAARSFAGARLKSHIHQRFRLAHSMSAVATGTTASYIRQVRTSAIFFSSTQPATKTTTVATMEPNTRTTDSFPMDSKYFVGRSASDWQSDVVARFGCDSPMELPPPLGVSALSWICPPGLGSASVLSTALA